ncbi:MAG: ABC transporter permease [Rhodospirillales bacterium]|nr:ABC transporter permease [Rhodospirillales bacterium]MDP7101312.1 ABC transporter permease [Rhodospirillales bacterium]
MTTVPIEATPVDRERSSITWGGFSLAFWLPVTWMVTLLFTVALADILPIREPTESDFTALKARPGLEFWLGTDVLGRDIFARIIHGARISLTVGFFAPVFGMIIGLIFGMMAGYYRGKLESIIVGVIDVILAFPNIVLAMCILFFAGATMVNLIIVLSVTSIPANTRIARASTLVFAGREFVMAARAQGASDLRILWHEILPNIVLPQLAYILSFMSIVIMIEGSLAFLGVGIPPPTPTLGGMIAQGFPDINTDPHITFMPALILFLTVLSLNLIGDQLRHKFTIRESAL